MTGAEPVDGDVTTNDFLGGTLRIVQPRLGYRAGIDAVLLAAAVPAQPGHSVLDLGCGVGVAALCLGRRVPGMRLVGLELQPDYAELAVHNAAENALLFEVHEGDLSDMPRMLRQQQFDHVIANPPYFDRAAGTPATDAGRETAMGERTPLAEWVKQAARRCAPGGHVSLIHRAERLPELLTEVARHLGSIELLPLIPRRGRDARLVLIRSRKGGRAEFRLHDGWILHEGGAHPGDRENYTAATASVLRHGQALPFSGSF
ncbi:MAG: methyltransferase [Roseovarius sp.]|uniref:tRNA1(Val) (adenine(37)-N6)-methyltransferase n=1 Tax=Roseovarius sp. TaxID=1486281 RepID=UPI0032F00C01